MSTARFSAPDSSALCFLKARANSSRIALHHLSAGIGRSSPASLFLVLALSIGASLPWFWILQRGEASRVSAYFFLTPIFALLLSAILLNEPLAPTDALGLAIIAAGLWLVARA